MAKGHNTNYFGLFHKLEWLWDAGLSWGKPDWAARRGTATGSSLCFLSGQMLNLNAMKPH